MWFSEKSTGAKMHGPRWALLIHFGFGAHILFYFILFYLFFFLRFVVVVVVRLFCYNYNLSLPFLYYYIFPSALFDPHLSFVCLGNSLCFVIVAISEYLKSFGVKFQTTFVVCFFLFLQTSAWKDVICKVERLNVKQRRLMWAVSSGSMVFATVYYYRLWQWKNLFSCPFK